ncbi:tRNA(Ile)-lysidine synthase [Micrococcus luteus]|uniref:tRNA(Ile)-lysidine synthase n=4 Tax=Bacillati TaxID=1783272 RepID=A0AAP5WCP2_9MICC|nr:MULTISPECIES: tRNA lysidine(34) synthetase TilS [Micrococcus]EZP44594.1 tRNA(Ile)-lysidine synthase [Micrococcus luteus]EZP44645.1 tRNA(Ile)-lysidine synthase [Micrococcus luteus]KYK09135.1 tRNA(Ile)-lysidine synthetase [Micrococcus sp. CH7]MBA9080914.1 tRNA(Ile)-lysidine synthase [Micrococcus aloeverae]MDV7176835.1 tRNA lysidine(34) synthetase TilS [Micrococcus yunnanensis]
MPRPEARDPGPTPAGGAGGLPAVGAWPPRTRWPEPLHRAVAAVREALAGDGSCRADAGPGRAGNRPRGLVALSGGADSLALAVACAVLVGTRDGARLGPIGAAVVDHGLQSGSDAVAAAAADVARILGLTPVTVTRVEVARTGDGPEADARRARRVALAAAARDAGQGAAAPGAGAAVVLTAHTADDQAEQVLLGLARGSGTRSLAGIPARGTLPGGAAVVRPLLGLARADTEAICRWAGLTWFEDPHNRDPALLRSRVRTRVLPALEDPDAGLGPGVRVGLVRTAAIAAEDAAALDAWAGDEVTRLRVDPPAGDPRVVSLDLDALAALPAAVRHRVIARAARAAGGQAPPRERILAVDALVTGARAGGTSAGPVELPGGVAVHRACARLDLIPCLPGP